MIPTEREIAFADDKAELAWQVAEAVDDASLTIPVEGQRLNARFVSFEPENARRGRYAIFLSGSVIGTEEKGVFLVPQRSLFILEKIGILYNSVLR